MQKSGFTLIELLVVIAIIALLLSILSPSLQMAKKSARNVVCQSNLHQWGIVWATFFQNNDDRVIGGDQNPEAQAISFTPTDGSPGAEAWPEVLYSYYRDKDVQFCPEALREEGIEYGDKNTAWTYGWEDTEYGGSYGINDWAYNPPQGVTTTWEIPLEGGNWDSPSVNRANNVPLFLDCVTIGSVPFDTDQPPEEDELPYYYEDSLMARYCMDRHGKGRINCLFLDSSARAIGLKELWKFKWHRQFDINGPWTLAGGVEADDWPRWMRRFKDY